MPLVLRWWWILGLALLTPVALPAGGGERGKFSICDRERCDPFIIFNEHYLSSSPILDAPKIAKVDPGTPFNFIRGCNMHDGTYWIYVDLSSSSIFDLSLAPKRGWLLIS